MSLTDDTFSLLTGVGTQVAEEVLGVGNALGLLNLLERPRVALVSHCSRVHLEFWVTEGKRKKRPQNGAVVRFKGGKFQVGFLRDFLCGH